MNSREMFQRRAISCAAMNCVNRFWWPPTASNHASLNAKPGWIEFVPRPTIDMLSTPHAMPMSYAPAITPCATKWAACCAEPHCRSTDVAGTSHGKPAAIHALRVTLEPCAPVCVTHPPTTSSTTSGSRSARSSRAFNTAPSRSVGCVFERRPFFLPIGLLAAPTMYASAIPVLLRRTHARAQRVGLRDIHLECVVLEVARQDHSVIPFGRFEAYVFVEHFVANLLRLTVYRLSQAAAAASLIVYLRALLQRQ